MRIEWVILGSRASDSSSPPGSGRNKRGTCPLPIPFAGLFGFPPNEPLRQSLWGPEPPLGYLCRRIRVSPIVSHIPANGTVSHGAGGLGWRAQALSTTVTTD